MTDPRVRPGGLSDRLALLGVLTGAWVAQGCSVLARLGVPDLLADGPRGPAELAAAAGADPTALGRVLRALAAAGLLAEPEPGRYALTPVSALLRSDVPGSLRAAAVVYGEHVHRSFGGLADTVRTGRPAFDRLYGEPFYDHLRRDPELEQVFTEAQGGIGVPSVLRDAGWPAEGTVVDVGGGDGGLLARVLPTRPGLTGVLLEQPGALDRAAGRLAAAGVADRVRLVAGSFFDPLPAGETYVLSRVLHNWADERAGALLRGVRAAIPAGGRLLVAEELLPDTPRPSAGPSGGAAAADRLGAAARMTDLLMLVLLEGRDRTAGEYAALLAGAGFTVAAVHPAPGRRRSPESLIVARPAERGDR